MREATIPMIGPAVGEVPKYLIGIKFWIWGVPGTAVMVNVNAPRAMAPGISFLVMLASSKI